MIIARAVHHETVKPEPVNQQMRHFLAFGLLFHVAVQLMVDDRQLLPCQHGGVFVIRTKAVVIEQVFAPVIRADEGEIFPRHPQLFGQLPLFRADCAFARG